MIRNRILFVDDDAINQWLLTDTLNELGFTVTGLCRGADALALLAQGQDFDLLLTDLRLPDGMSGFELAEQWRHWQPGRPILYTGTEPLFIAGRLDCDEGFIRKHAESDELTAIIEPLLYDLPPGVVPRAAKRTLYLH